ncbi:MAG TPA: sugar phosphate isomerase/epimerase family protein [Cyclobacteriaceae bacterium]|jgi:sugar phosphate isomerase/epimerase|nr:sugar phosphate isomerase/epimerase family protein [Cyclobacteriaceae bacterium]
MNQTRREFVKASAALLAASWSGLAFDSKYSPKLSFSTLGCPDWTFQQIVDFGAQHHYQGIEVRGILKQLDLTKCKEFSKENKSTTLKMMNDNGLKFVNLGASSVLHLANPEDRKKSLDEAKTFIDLAQEFDCPYIRVFPNIFPKEQDRNATMDLMIKGLLELASYANGTNVSVLVESHGDLLSVEDLEKVMGAAAHPHAGLVWDVTNMWIKTKESPTLAYEKLKKYIRHTHIKDAKLVGDKINYVLLGKGEVPIFEAIDVLAKGGYDGYFSFEWEKHWHPEIEASDLAIGNYADVMRKHFQG